MKQIEIAEAECYCPVDVELIAGAAHSPHREAPEATLRAVADFANRLLRLYGEGELRAA
jgi:pimeloyl-ACP methyl ester carboxylesterase